jgi:hypothetical protein
VTFQEPTTGNVEELIIKEEVKRRCRKKYDRVKLPHFQEV